MTCLSRRHSTTLALATTAVLALGMAGTSYAGTSNVVVSGSGSVAMTSPSIGAFGPVSLTGAGVTTTANVGAFTVTDTSLPAMGWKVTVSATQFCQGAAPSSSTCSGTGLPVGSLTVHGPTTASGGSGTAPSFPTTTAPIDGLAAATVVSAPLGTTGVWNVGSSSLSLNVPASTMPGTYYSTVTYTATTSP